MSSKRNEEANAARLVQVSLVKANQAMQSGDKEAARKIYRSTHDLCVRVDAPPPVHGLVVRGFCDLLRREATPAAYTEGREVISNVVERLEGSEYREGIPKEIQTDLRARLGDLLAAWGELEREGGDVDKSIEVLEKAVAAFKRMGNAYEYMAATQNRLAVTLIEKGDGQGALEALQRAEEYAESVPQHQDQLMTQTICHRASAYARLQQNEKAIEHFHVALDRAHATGDETLAAEINQRLSLFEEESARVAPSAPQQPAAVAAGADQFL